MQKTKGKFIAIDGIDGCGKTTQSVKIVNYLQSKGFDTVLTRQPGGTDLGNTLRNLLVSTDYELNPICETLLYFADRSAHHEKVIVPSMAENKIVVCDRFLASTYAYQAFGMGVELDFIDILTKYTVNKKPDLAIIVDVPIERALERAKRRLVDEMKINIEGKYEMHGYDFFKRVREGFYWYCENHDNVVILKGDKSAEDIFKDIEKIIRDLLE